SITHIGRETAAIPISERLTLTCPDLVLAFPALVSVPNLPHHMTGALTSVANRPAPTHVSERPDVLIPPEITPDYVPSLPFMPNISTDLSVNTTPTDDVRCQIIHHVATQTRTIARFEACFVCLDRIIIIFRQQLQTLSVSNNTIAEALTSVAEQVSNIAQQVTSIAQQDGRYAVSSSLDEDNGD
ncbi:hypothetical protein U1Q18_000985, partial [Sarracenia purpurea var. burkii]